MADDVVYPWALVNTSSAMTSGTPVYYLVRVSQDRFYDAVKFLMDGTSMTSFYVAIFRPTTANTLSLVMDLGNVKSQLTSSMSLQTVALTQPLDAEAGETFMVGLLSVGGTQPSIYTTNQVAYQLSNITTGTIPEFNQITAVGATGSQTSFSSTMTLSTSYLLNSGMRIWGSLGNALPPERSAAFFVDSFNRINTTQLSLPWGSRDDCGTFGIYNNTASPNTGGAGMPFHYWVPSIRSDNHYIQAKLGADMATDAAQGVNLYLGVRAGRGGSGQSVKLHLYSSAPTQFRIVTVTSTNDNTGLVQRAAAATPPSFNLGDVVKLVADNTVYTAFYNDNPLISWVDSGGIQPINSDQRGINIATSAVSTNNLQVIDNLEFGDFGGGVQLIGLTGIPSSAAFGAATIQNNVSPTPAALSLTVTGRAPALNTGPAVPPGKLSLSLTGYAPSISTPAPSIIEENQTRTNQPVPTNVGCWVTLIGGGGAGGPGASSSSAIYRPGGGGGGGGARIERVFIPASLLGSTYTTVRGLGASAAAGGASQFKSGGVLLTAGGGGAGGTGMAGQTNSNGGFGGTYSISGVSAIGHNGTVGGTNYGGNSPVVSSAPQAGAGGSGGSDLLANGNVSGTPYPGGNTTVAGGASPSTSGNDGGTADPQSSGGSGASGGRAYNGGNGYAGGFGGSYGGGGGGNGACASGGQPSRSGGNGYIKVEWV